MPRPASTSPDFNPITQARRGFGLWGLFQDSTGTLWAGGDFAYSTRAGQVNQWSGGFIRFGHARLVGTLDTGRRERSTPVDGTTALLSWSASSDNRGVTGYEVIRDNKVVQTTTALELNVPVAATPTPRTSCGRWMPRGTARPRPRSCSSRPPLADDLTFVVTGDTWRWQYKLGGMAGGMERPWVQRLLVGAGSIVPGLQLVADRDRHPRRPHRRRGRSAHSSASRSA